MLYGSLRAKSYSWFLTFEAAKLLERFGAEVKIFNPSGLPLPDPAKLVGFAQPGRAREVRLGF